MKDYERCLKDLKLLKEEARDIELTFNDIKEYKPYTREKLHEYWYYSRKNGEDFLEKASQINNKYLELKAKFDPDSSQFADIDMYDYFGFDINGFESAKPFEYWFGYLDNIKGKIDLTIAKVNSNIRTFNEKYTSSERLTMLLIEKIYEDFISNPTGYSNSTPSISQQRKHAVKKRDEFTCQICNEIFLEDELVVDHIFPFSYKSSNLKPNLMALCKECNSDKGNRLEYYKSDEGRRKLKLNVEDYVKSLLIYMDFSEWIKKAKVYKKPTD